MRLRRAAVFAAVLLTLALGPANAIAAQPVSGPAADGRFAGVERGTSGTFDLRDGGHVHIHRTQAGARAHSAAAGAAGTNNGINYHGGPIVPAEHVVSIYWAKTQVFPGGPTPGTSGGASSDGSLVGYYLRNLGGSNHYNINTTYTDTVGSGHTVANALSYAGFWADNGSTAPAVGSSPTDLQIQAEIGNYFTTFNTTPDPSTVYAVFSASGVNLGGGAYTQYCAYHGDFLYKGAVVLYAAMPYDNASGCNALVGSPNNDPAADAEVNVLSHELEEANTDPQLNAWYDNSGAENGDKCAWNFGSTFVSTKNGNGAANITVGTRDFLVQQNWLNANGGGCYQGYTSPAPSVLTTVTVSPASASVTTGGTRQFTATGNDQYGAAMSPQPSFTWSAATGGDGSIDPATGMFTAGSTAGGPFPVTATANGISGTASVTVTTVTPGFAISVTPSSQSIRRGTTATYAVTITPSGGFSGAVTLSASGQPSGSTVTFTPNNTALTASTLKVATLSATSRRTYTLTIKAVSGSLSHTSNVTLTVTR
jgi:hypothetical protein